MLNIWCDFMDLSQLDRKQMNFAMRLSFAVGVVMLFVKMYAYWITGSAAVLSDAAESVIHVFAVGFATYSMWLSLKPPDREHLYGHEKVGFFSAGFEGAMIIGAACFILYQSIKKIITGFEVENVDAGLEFTFAVVIVNFFLAFYLMRQGRRYRSIVLEANGKHILTDCWTSAAAIVSLGLVKMTGISLFDPCIALIAAVNIFWTGSRLIKRCVGGLMDKADLDVHEKLSAILLTEVEVRGLEFHHLRHRHSGSRIFVEFHLLFPQEITLAAAHEVASEIEAALKSGLDLDTDIFTHLEPKESHDQTHEKYGLPI